MRHDFFVTVLLHLKFRRYLLREPIHGKRAAKGTKEPRHRDYFDAAEDAADQTFDQDRRKGTDVENERLQRPNFGNRAVLK